MNVNSESIKHRSQRAEIEQLFLAFSRALEENDYSSMGDYFTTGAKAFLSNLGSFDGADAIVAGLSEGNPENEIQRFRITNSYIAIAGERAQQSAYLMGFMAEGTEDGELDSFLFGGHFANSYIHTPGGWKIAELRFELDWNEGNHDYVAHWNINTGRARWNNKVEAPVILSEIDAPWRVFPNPDEQGTDEEQIAETYIRYAWGLDQADFDLLATTFTEDAKADMSPFGPMDGQREIVSLLKFLRNGQPYMQHAATNFQVNVTGDTATMDIYRVVPFAPTKETLDASIFGARYESRLRRDQGVWKFEWLHYIPGWIQID